MLSKLWELTWYAHIGACHAESVRVSALHRSLYEARDAGRVPYHAMVTRSHHGLMLSCPALCHQASARAIFLTACRCIRTSARLGRYMIRCPVVLERMSLDEDTGEVLYRTRPSRASVRSMPRPSTPAAPTCPRACRCSSTSAY